MRLKNEKPTKNFRDFTWVPQNQPLLMQYLLWGAPDYVNSGGPYPSNDSFINSPYGDMSPDEIELIKSGANLKQILFERALQQQNKEGFSPYFNPNYQRK